MIGDTRHRSAEDRRYYECRECLTRLSVSETLSACPDCGGRVRNLAVARE